MAQANLAYNSQTEIVTENGEKYIIKTFRLALPRPDAEEIRQQVILQRHGFERMHVPTSKMVDIDLKPDDQSDKGFRLIIKEIFAGLDFMDVVTNDNFTMYFDRLLDDVFKPLLKSTDKQYLSAGIDGSLRNFVYDNKVGEFCYVDFLPPKVFYKGKYTQEIPELTDEDFFNIRLISHNDRAGIVYNLFVNTIREFPSQLNFASGKLEQFTKEINEPELFKFIAASPIYRAHDTKQVTKTIDSIEDWKGTNFFLLREIANWLNNQNTDLADLKKEIFAATSQERDPNSPDYGRISADNFAKTIKLLRRGIKQCE